MLGPFRKWKELEQCPKIANLLIKSVMYRTPAAAATRSTIRRLREIAEV